MITKKQLNLIGYHPSQNDKTMFVAHGSWEYGFCISKQELWFLNDGFGEPQFECKITDFQLLKDFLELKNEIYENI